jgi:hypothetical protein
MLMRGRHSWNSQEKDPAPVRQGREQRENKGLMRADTPGTAGQEDPAVWPGAENRETDKGS